MLVPTFNDLDTLRNHLRDDACGEQVIVFRSKASIRPWAVISVHFDPSADASMFLRDLGRFDDFEKACDFADAAQFQTKPEPNALHCLGA